MDGSVAVVVGSGGGIGREIALRMGAEGADVVLSGRSAGQMEEVAGLELRADARLDRTQAHYGSTALPWRPRRGGCRTDTTVSDLGAKTCCGRPGSGPRRARERSLRSRDPTPSLGDVEAGMRTVANVGSVDGAGEPGTGRRFVSGGL